LRVDAERNRVALLAAAREVFAEHGLEAPLEEVAQRAGVGIATLYRRFGTREGLVDAALAEKIGDYADAAEAALSIPDPRAGFAGFVERICSLQAEDRGLSDLLSMTLPASKEVERLRGVANDRVIRLVDRAKAAGVVRPDFVGEDLLLLLIANAAILRVTRQDAPGAWRRFVALVLDAFAASDASPLPAPPSTSEMAEAMRRLARERGCAERS
jgi:AcrR family transcriptional regulator